MSVLERRLILPAVSEVDAFPSSWLTVNDNNSANGAAVHQRDHMTGNRNQMWHLEKKKANSVCSPRTLRCLPTSSALSLASEIDMVRLPTDGVLI